MTYATQADMLTEFDQAELIQLTDREPPLTGAIVTAVLDRALDDASAEIDGYLARYSGQSINLPILRRYCCDMARYRLYRAAVPEEVRNRYRDALRFLELVAKGTISLGPDAEAAVPTNTVNFNIGQKVFARESLDG